jgi:hypothetical protein
MQLAGAVDDHRHAERGYVSLRDGGVGRTSGIFQESIDESFDRSNSPRKNRVMPLARGELACQP